MSNLEQKLLAALKQPGMSEDLFRKGLAQCHKEDGPVYGMETDYVLADQMKVCRPVFLIQFAVVSVSVISYTGDVVA